MGKWIAFAIVAAPGSALAHHGGAAEIGIGAGAVAIATAVVLLAVRSRYRATRG